jgi:ribosomal-protein-alanine N-acetyltransferase
VEAIRPLVLADAEALTALLVRNREFLAPFEPARPPDFFTVEAQIERLGVFEHQREEGTGFAWAIVDGVELAGVAALSNVARGVFESANLGYWVDAARNGRGLATRAVGAVAEEAFGPLALHRLEAGTLVDNAASQRVLEKNGFARIGIAERYLRIAGAWRDHVLFQRLADTN